MDGQVLRKGCSWWASHVATGAELQAAELTSSRRWPQPFADTTAFDLDNNRRKVRTLFLLHSLGNTAPAGKSELEFRRVCPTPIPCCQVWREGLFSRNQRRNPGGDAAREARPRAPAPGKPSRGLSLPSSLPQHLGLGKLKEPRARGLGITTKAQTPPGLPPEHHPDLPPHLSPGSPPGIHW